MYVCKFCVSLGIQRVPGFYVSLGVQKRVLESVAR